MLFYPIFLVIYFFVLFLYRRGYFGATESLDLIEVINVFQLWMLFHLIYVLFFTKNNMVKIIVFALFVYSIIVIFITINELNPF